MVRAFLLLHFVPLTDCVLLSCGAALLFVLQDTGRQGGRSRAQKWCSRPPELTTPSFRLVTRSCCYLALADLAIRGTLHSVDQYLNIKLLSISVEDSANYPHMQSVKNCFIRGSVIKYVQLPASEVDTELLQDATRREAQQQKEKGGGR